MIIKTIKIETLKKNDIILDGEGLEMLVKNIAKKKGTLFEITVNYVESGFYRCNNTKWEKRGSTLCQKICT